MDFERVYLRLEKAVHVDRILPGTSIAVWKDGEELYSDFVGLAEKTPNPRVVQRDGIWDFASVSKVLGTVPLIMYLVAKGELELDAPISKYLSHAPKGPTIKNCL